MALNVNSALGAKTIAELAAVRLYESFPLNLVSHATGTRAFKMPYVAAATTGTVAVVAENAAQASMDTYKPTIALMQKTLDTYRANVTVTNELLQDSSVLDLIARRLSGQLTEVICNTIISNITANLIAASRFTIQDTFSDPSSMDAGTPVHSGFECMANLSNVVRDRSVWVFGKLGYQSFGDMEGRASLVTLPIQRKSGKGGMFDSSESGGGGGGYSQGKQTGGWYIPADGTSGNGSILTGSTNQTQQLLAGGGGGGGLAPPAFEIELSKNLDLETRGSNPLNVVGLEPFELTTAWLGKPVYTSGGMGVMSSLNAMWMMLVDLSAYLHFSQPLQITLDTESLAENNRTVIQCSYRCAGDLMDSNSGYGLRHASS